MTAHLVGSTLIRIHHFYIQYPKRMLDLCALVSLASIVFSVAMGAVITYTAYALHLIPDAHAADFNMVVYFGMFDDLYGTVEAFVCLSLALFAIHLRRSGPIQVAEGGFKFFWRSITPANWTAFAIACAIIFLLKTAFFRPVFDTGGSGYWDSLDLTSGYDQPVRHRLLAWANEVMVYVLGYVPYLLMVYLLLNEEGFRWSRATVRPLLPALWSILLLVFLINAVHASIHGLFSNYLFPPFTIIFEGSMLPLTFQLIFVLLVMALLLPSFLLCLVVPLEERASVPGREVG